MNFLHTAQPIFLCGIDFQKLNINKNNFLSQMSLLFNWLYIVGAVTNFCCISESNQRQKLK